MFQVFFVPLVSDGYGGVDGAGERKCAQRVDELVHNNNKLTDMNFSDKSTPGFTDLPRKQQILSIY